jgi:hypothetical protein
LPEPHPYKTALQAGDHAGLVSTFAREIHLNSPTLFEPIIGRKTVAFVFAAVIDVLEDLTFFDELTADERIGLAFTARVGDVQIEGIDLLMLDHEGLITELTVMMRPLTAAQAFAAAMGRRLGTAEFRSAGAAS